MYYRVKKTFVREDDRLKSYSRAHLQDLTQYKKYSTEVRDNCIRGQLINDSYKMPTFTAEGNKKMASVMIGNYTGTFYFFVSLELLQLFLKLDTSKFQGRKVEMVYRKKEKEYHLVNFFEKIEGIDFANSSFLADRNTSTYANQSRNPPIPLEELHIPNYEAYYKMRAENDFGIRIKNLNVRNDTNLDFFRFEFGFACSQRFKDECIKHKITGLEFSKFPIQSIF